MCRLLIAVLSLLSLSSTAFGQWQIVAWNILGTSVPIPYAGGVITYQTGRVWAGDRSLWYSDDLGVTWRRSTLVIDSANQRITDVAFFDAMHGVVSTFAVTTWGKLYQTSDGGATWSVIDSIKDNGYVSIAYGRTAADITATGATTRITHNGGQSWANGTNADLFVVRQGSRLLTILPGTPSSSHLGESFDDGLTWNPSAAAVPLDCYSLALDSCDPNYIILANENYFYSNPPISNLFVTTNSGTSWVATLTSGQNTNRLTGSLARGKRAIYATTLRDGVLQSVDHGYTWKDISGPSGTADSRGICCISDNLVLVCDPYGSIWRTANAGGNPVTVPEPGTYRLNPPRLFSTDTLSVCDSSVTRIARLLSVPCDRRERTREVIVGPDSSHFRLLRGLPQYSTGFDSVIISFRADSARVYRAYYTVQRGQGSDTIYLVGYGRAPLRAIAPDVSRLAFDTVRPCGNAIRTLWLHSTSCTPWRITSITLNGADSSHFTLDRAAPFMLTGRDSITVGFVPDSSRSYAASLHVVLDDGTSFNVPVVGFGTSVSAAITQSRLSLFDSVQRSFCQSAVQSFWINDTACLTHRILRTLVVGPDSTYYAASAYRSGALPDSITVLFTPDSVRDYHATLELLLSDSSVVTVRLAGSGVKVQHAFAPPDLSQFADSLGACDTSVVHWLVFHDTACQWRSAPVVSLSDSSHFSTLEVRPGKTIDSVLVRFSGDSAARYEATLFMQYDDTTITIPLTGYGKNTERSLRAYPTSLFIQDTVSPCGLPLLQYVAIADSSCLPWYVLGYRWSGADSVYYRLIRRLPSPLTGHDTLAILFSPDAPRHYSSGLTVLLSDGREIPFTLAGDGAPYKEIALCTAAHLSTQIVGDVLRVPIYVRHTAPMPTLRFAVHFDTALLRFAGGRTTDGGTIPMTGNPNSGNINGRIDSVSTRTDSLIGFLDFQIFPTTDSCGFVTIDSLQFESNASKICALITDDSAVVRLCGPLDCTTPIFSNFLRYSRLPVLGVSPNPTASEVTISTDMDIGKATISVYNELGVTLRTEVMELIPGAPAAIPMDAMPRGTYYLTITLASGYKKSFTVVRE